jgi:hypothetical protein
MFTVSSISDQDALRRDLPDEPSRMTVTCAPWWKQFADAAGVGDTPDVALA